MNSHEFKLISNLLKNLEAKYGPGLYQKTYSNSGIKELLRGIGTPSFHIKFFMENSRVSRGVYDLKILLKLLSEVKVSNNPSSIETSNQIPVPTKVEVVNPVTPVVVNPPVIVDYTYNRQNEFNKTNYIPRKDVDFVPFGFYNAFKTILESKKFFPCYITGPSGLGKNMTVSQACQALNRPMVLVSITEETSDDDLIGCWTLQNGNTLWKEGPVVFAARHGMVVVLDEIDLSTPKIMCLQSILNGDPIYIEPTGELLTPKEGFNIIATGNTKGFGESSIHIGTQALNEAFLERFKIMFDHGFPTAGILKRIVKKKMEHLGLEEDKDKEFAANLVQFVDYVAAAYKSESIDYFISNRRLSAIIETYSIFKDVVQALTLGLSRFPKPIVQTFLSLYTKIDTSINLTPDEIFESMKKELEGID